MKGIVEKVDTELGGMLESWDGTVKTLEIINVYLDGPVKQGKSGKSPPAPHQ